MIVLERNKVYKVVHERVFFSDFFNRDYIIFSPKNMCIIEENSIGKKHVPHLKQVVKIKCLFSIDFCGEACMNLDTSIFTDCHFEPLNTNDINDIKKAIDTRVLNGYKYNRKLNTLIELEHVES